MARGDHIYVQRWRGLYEHHGIDCGDGSVIHYNGDDAWTSRVIRTPLESFALGTPIQIRDYSRLEARFGRPGGRLDEARREWNRALDRFRGLPQVPLDMSEEMVMERAMSRLGEDHFDWVFNNCEHFASWCKTGISESRQVDSLWLRALTPNVYLERRLASVGRWLTEAGLSRPWSRR